MLLINYDLGIYLSPKYYRPAARGQTSTSEHISRRPLGNSDCALLCASTESAIRVLFKYLRKLTGLANSAPDIEE